MLSVLIIMQDGAIASYNATNDVLIASGISSLLKKLMCWFHVKFNIKKRLHGMAPIYDLVMQYIDKMQYCKTFEEYEQLKPQVLDKWTKIPLIGQSEVAFQSSHILKL